MAEERPYTDIELDDGNMDFERGFIVVAEGLAWGPFLLPEHALGFALKHQPDTMFKLMPLLNPAIIG